MTTKIIILFTANKYNKFKKPVSYNEAMKWFSCVNSSDSKKNCEQIYIFEHDDVYTYGKSIKKDSKVPSHINGIETVQANRGGLWTWHGKGQIMIYFVLNLRKRKMNLHDWFKIIEPIFVQLIQTEIGDKRYSVYADKDKRGFWVKDIQSGNISKIGFIGLRIINGFLTHGISINYNNNLEPFKHINPCGLGDVKITSIKELKKDDSENSQKIETEKELFKEKIGKELSKAFD